MIRQLTIMLVAVAVSGSVALADVTFSFVASQNSYAVLPGEDVLVPIYLRETLTGGSVSRIAAEDGLYSFGLTVELTSGGGQILALDRNPAFDALNPGSTTSFPANPVKLNAEQAVGGNFGNGVLPDASGLLHLATLRFQAPLAGESAFSITDFNVGTGETVTYGFNELDALIAAGGFTVTTAIPEPAAAALLLISAIGLLGRRRAA